MTARRLVAVPDTAPRFGIGVRVSRVGGRAGERFLSPDIQIQAATKAIHLAGGVVDTTVGEDGVFYDMDVSGAVAPEDRPGLGQALELVRAGALQGVAVYDLSRFSRDTAGGLRALEAVAACGGQVLSASEAIDLDTPAGVFSTTVQLAAHSLRRAEASRSWKATHARRFEMGLPHGKLPYGYVNNNGHATPDPVLGPAISNAFTEYAAGTTTQRTLADRLGALRGKAMRQGVISQLLRNRFYVGEVEFLGEVRPGAHEPLVQEQTFQAVQRRLSFERAAGPHWRLPQSPVVGMVFCVVCHRPLYRQGAGNRGGRPRDNVMICAGKAPGLCDGIGTPKVGDLEVAVKELALKEARYLRDVTPAQVERNSRAARAQADLARIKAERNEVLNVMGRLGESLGRNVMTEDEYVAAVTPLRGQLESLDSRRVVLEAAEAQVSRPLEELASAAERIEQLWGVMTAKEQRAQLMLFVPRVEVRRAAYRGEPMGDRLVLPD